MSYFPEGWSSFWQCIMLVEREQQQKKKDREEPVGKYMTGKKKAAIEMGSGK